LADVREGLAPGQNLRAGEAFARMGRTTNTREPIAKERAHLHFELNLLINDRFPEWFQDSMPGQTNYHGSWNGQNFLGLDPQILLLSSHRFATNFNLTRYLTEQPELLRVDVRSTNFPWLHRYPMLIQPSPTPADGPPAGYELHLDYNGVPVRLVPKTASQLGSPERFALVSVNEEEYRLNPCRRLVVKTGDRFKLGPAGIRLLGLLCF
jgi:hypothetical protein